MIHCSLQTKTSKEAMLHQENRMYDAIVIVIMMKGQEE